jgi:hypothetical protein
MIAIYQELGTNSVGTSKALIRGESAALFASEAFARPHRFQHERLAPCEFCVLSLAALFSSCMVSAQGTGNRLADNIDTGRTIIAKLDHAAQGDPPPNFASSILVCNHQDAVNLISLAPKRSWVSRQLILVFTRNLYAFVV